MSHYLQLCRSETLMVGARCAVASCSNSYTAAKKRGHVLSLHSFPKDRDLKELWIKACSRGDAWNPETSFICSDHFALEDFISDQRLQLWTGVKWRPQLRPGAIPTRNLPKTKCDKNMGRTRRPHQRFSMFQVVSIELESRLEKMQKDSNRPPDDSVETNVGSTGRSGSLESYGDTVDLTGSNQLIPSETIASDGNHGRLAEGGTSDFCDTSDIENFESSDSEYFLCPLKKSRTDPEQPVCSILESPSINRDTTGSRDSPTKQMNDCDFSTRESQLSTVNSTVIYSCPAFELFVDDEPPNQSREVEL